MAICYFVIRYYFILFCYYFFFKLSFCVRIAEGKLITHVIWKFSRKIIYDRFSRWSGKTYGVAKFALCKFSHAIIKLELRLMSTFLALLELTSWCNICQNLRFQENLVFCFRKSKTQMFLVLTHYNLDHHKDMRSGLIKILCFRKNSSCFKFKIFHFFFLIFLIEK